MEPVTKLWQAEVEMKRGPRAKKVHIQRAVIAAATREEADTKLRDSDNFRKWVEYWGVAGVWIEREPETDVYVLGSMVRSTSDQRAWASLREREDLAGRE